MTEMRSRWDGVHVHHFPCDCGDIHYVSISVDERDPEWRFLDIAEATHPRGWRDRLKAAFTMLRGKTHYHSGVLLDPANTEDMKRVLDWMLTLPVDKVKR